MSFIQNKYLFRFKNSGLLSLFITLFGTFLSLVLTVILTRSLSVDDFGLYSYNLAFLNILSVFAVFGLKNYSIRTIPSITVFEDNDFSSFIYFSFLFVVAASVFLALGLFLINLVLDDSKILYLSIFILPLLSISQLLSGTLSGLGFPSFSNFHDSILRQIAIICSVSILFFFDLLNLNNLLLSLMISYLLSFLPYLKFQFPSRNNVVLDNKKVHEWITGSIPFFLFSVVAVLHENLPQVIIMKFSSSSEVSFFKISYVAGSIMSFVLLSYTSVSLNLIRSYFTLNQFKNIVQLSKNVAIKSFLLSFPIFLSLLFFGEFLVSLTFGPQYLPILFSIKIYCFFKCIISLFGIPGSIMLMCDKNKELMIIWALSLVLGFSFGIYLTSEFGHLGAIFSIILVELSNQIMLFFYVFKKMKINSTAFA